MNEITIGQMAPDFWLPTDDEKSVSLTGLAGKTIVLYFYPKNDTPGCTSQASAFTALKSQFELANGVVIGVSKDTIASHKKFRQKYGLSHILASDNEHQVSELFGVWVEKNMYGRKYMGLERATFVIDAQGKVSHIWRKVKVTGHGEDVLKIVQKIAPAN